jgi:predicted choloylglycine hydrolase
MAKTDLVFLHGTARERGRLQAKTAPGLHGGVLQAISGPLHAAATTLSEPHMQQYLDKQWRFTEQNGKNHLEEIEGLATGFGFSALDLFAFLHLSFLSPDIPPADGCSTIALSNSSDGPVLAKNRDYAGEHHRLQRVFLHQDPTQGNKRCLFVGSLGCPGAFSSGMNSDGLAVVDTRVDRREPGVGWLRYFLMTEMLWKASSVSEAVEIIRSCPHVGGGSLTIADSTGSIASVELGSPDAHIEAKDSGGFVHTNHFLSHPLLSAMGPRDAKERSSVGRLASLTNALPGLTQSANRRDILRLMSSHGDDNHRLCLHAGSEASFTISSVVYLCRTRELIFSNGPPCKEKWQTFTL